MSKPHRLPQFRGDSHLDYASLPYAARMALFRQRLRERDGNVCALCDAELGARVELDHIIPKSRGGEFVWDNLRATHPACNRSRGNGMIDLRLDYYLNREAI